MVDLTEAQLRHFAFTFIWLSMFGGALGALAYGLFIVTFTRLITWAGNWMDRATRIYTARMRAFARQRLDSNG